MKDINLYERYVESTVKRRDVKKTLLTVLPIVVLVAALIGVYFFQYFRLNTLKKDNKELKSYVNDSSNAETLKQTDQYDKQNAAIDVAVEQLTYFRGVYQLFPVFTRDLFKTMDQLTSQYGITISAWEYTKAKGTLSITGITANNEQIADFVAKLRESEQFVAVRYSGYLQHQDSTLSADAVSTNVSFSVELVVNPLMVSQASTEESGEEESLNE